MSFWRPGDAAPPPAPAAQAPPPAEGPGRVSGLSKNVMGMKFMKRKEEGAEQSREEASKRRKLLETVQQLGPPQSSSAMQVDEPAAGGGATSSSSSSSSSFTIETTDLYSTLPGRRSFGGFNKVVERNYNEVLDLSADKSKREQQGGAGKSDEEILRQVQGLVGLPRGPGQGKKPRPAGLQGKPGAGAGGSKSKPKQ